MPLTTFEKQIRIHKPLGIYANGRCTQAIMDVPSEYVQQNKVEVFKVNSSVLKSHELFVLKSTLSILNSKTLLSGPLDKLPERQPVLPSYAIKERLSDNTDSYVSGKGDQQGEKKIDKEGNLKGGREYLFATFTFSCPNNKNSRNRYVLVSHLIHSLNLETDENTFLGQNEDLYPIQATQHLISLLKEHNLLSIPEASSTELNYITARSAFLRFGASILASGSRVVDDYWEQPVKEQGFTEKHRVYALSLRTITLIAKLEPSFDAFNELRNEQNEAKFSFENPYLTITEPPSEEMKTEYKVSITKGDSIGVIPGQTIHGAIELSNNFKVPKYQIKNAYAAAQQNDALDIPIGSPSYPLESHTSGRGRKFNTITPEENEDPLQINGWKFNLLPLATSADISPNFSMKGLPFYKRKPLEERVKKLTPNEIKELERSHDVTLLNTGIGQLREQRISKWTKYWQHKAGVPVGLTEAQREYYRKIYLPECLRHVEVNVVPNETKNVDEKHTVKRIPNPNFLGNCNITGVRPPYVQKP